MKFLFYIGILCFLLTNCQTSKQVIELENHKTPKGSYTITQIGNTKLAISKLTIAFDETTRKVRGFAGCNSFFGNYKIESTNLSLGPLATSKKLCFDEVNYLESQFLKALNNTNTFTIEGDSLILYKNKSVLLKASKSKNSKKNSIKKSFGSTRIIYETKTRNEFEYLSISESNIVISKDPKLQSVTNYQCAKSDWALISQLINSIDLERFQKLKIPSDKRSNDGVAEANLILQLGDMEYISPSFDHGNPPKEIKALVNKVLSIKEKTLKQ